MSDNALYMSPERRRRMGNALMTDQFNRATPEEGNLVQRHGLLPLGVYDNGQTGLAFPGLLAQPVESFNRLMQNGYQSGDEQGVEDAFNVAGAAMTGGLLSPKPSNAVGHAAGHLQDTRVSGSVPGYSNFKMMTPMEDGEIGYRGSKTSKNRFRDPSLRGPWASSDPRIASTYANPNYMQSTSPSVQPMEFRFSNPVEINARGAAWDSIPTGNWFERMSTDDIGDKLKNSGHDGVVFRNVRDAEAWTDPSTPKSDVYHALKRGTVYSPLTGDLLYANGGKSGAAAGAAVNALDNTPGIRAYHGSPHDFDKFDLSKIGTGEGAQAYGHGLYFAENEGVAKSYRDALSNGGASSSLNAAEQSALEWAKPYLDQSGWDREKAARLADKAARGSLWGRPDGLSAARSTEAAALLRDQSKPIGSKGNMYEVNIKANPDDFLDFGRPLSEQGDAGVRAMEAITAHGRMNSVGPKSSAGAWADAWSTHPSGPKFGGKRAEELWSEAGIPGIRYLDQGSRTAGEGSRNYVVFDDKLIDILKKYGLLGMAGGAAAAEYGGGNSLLSPRPASPQYRPGDA